MQLAQLDRAFGYEPRGRGFESLIARHFVKKTVLFSGLFLRLKDNYLFLYYISTYEKMLMPGVIAKNLSNQTSQIKQI